MRVAQYCIHDSYPFKKDTVFELRPFTILEGDNLTGKTAMVEMLRRFFYNNADDNDYVRFVDSDEKIYADKTTADDRQIEWSALPMHSVSTDPYDYVVDDDDKLLGMMAEYFNPFVRHSSAFRDMCWKTSDNKSSRSLRNMLQKIGVILRNDRYVRQVIYIDKPEQFLSSPNVAMLTSVLMKIASEGKIEFIIETHSQTVLDRARIEIREGRELLDYNDLSFIHFAESSKGVTEVSNISFDKMANMQGVPTGYHDWDYYECKRLMGFSDDENGEES